MITWRGRPRVLINKHSFLVSLNYISMLGRNRYKSKKKYMSKMATDLTFFFLLLSVGTNESNLLDLSLTYNTTVNYSLLCRGWHGSELLLLAWF